MSTNWIYNPEIWWYVKDRREKDAIIATLQNELKSANMKVEENEKNGKARTVL